MNCQSDCSLESQALPAQCQFRNSRSLKVGGFVEVGIGCITNIHLLKEMLDEVRKVCYVEWDRDKDNVILVYCEKEPLTPIQFSLSRKFHDNKPEVVFTVVVYFYIPPASLLHEAWRILHAVTAGMELYPDLARSYSWACRFMAAPFRVSRLLPITPADNVVLDCIKTGFMDVVEVNCRMIQEDTIKPLTNWFGRGMVQIPTFLLPKPFFGTVVTLDGCIARGQERASLLQHQFVGIVPTASEFVTAVKWLVSLSSVNALTYLKLWLPILSETDVSVICEHTLIQLRCQSWSGIHEQQQVLSFEDVALHLWSGTPEQTEFALRMNRGNYWDD